MGLHLMGIRVEKGQVAQGIQTNEVLALEMNIAGK